jgi:hypothetical protein
VGGVVEAGKGLGTKRDRSRNRELGARGEEGVEDEGGRGERSSSFRAPTLQQQDISIRHDCLKGRLTRFRQLGGLGIYYRLGYLEKELLYTNSWVCPLKHDCLYGKLQFNTICCSTLLLLYWVMLFDKKISRNVY